MHIEEGVTMRLNKGKLYVALIPLIYALFAVFAPVIDRGIAPSGEEWVQLGMGVALALSVYFVPLVPQHTWIKSGIGAIIAGLGVLTTAIVGGVTAMEVLDIAVYVFAALGIVIAPASSDTGVAVGVGGDAPITT